jgi:hypothetical protein
MPTGIRPLDSSSSPIAIPPSAEADGVLAPFTSETYPFSVAHTSFGQQHMDMTILQQGTAEVVEDAHRTRHDILASVHLHDLAHSVIRGMLEHLLPLWALMEEIPKTLGHTERQVPMGHR